jgi:RNA polymerase sigma factor FliA
MVTRNYEEISNLSSEDRDRLVMEHLPQVRYIAKRIHERLPQQVQLEDLISAGVVGLMEAIHHFDASKNVQLKTYAKIRIQGAILDSLRDLDWGPRSLRRKAREVERVQQKLRADLGQQPTETQLAAEMDIDLSQLQQLLSDLRGLNLGSLQALVPEDGQPEDMYRYMPNAPDESPLYQCMRSELMECLSTAVGELPPRERQLLALYYVEELTMKEVGAVLGLGEARICQIHSAALIRLRTRLRELLDERPAPARVGERTYE